MHLEALKPGTARTERKVYAMSGVWRKKEDNADEEHEGIKEKNPHRGETRQTCRGFLNSGHFGSNTS